jgi:Mn-containing catalase
MKRNNPSSDLLMEELANLLNAETQLLEILPKMAQASESSALKAALENCLEITGEHISRIQDILNNIRQDPSKLICKAMQGFIEGIEDIVYDPQEYPARDTAIIRVAQRVQQYEIAEYKKARLYASDLGHTGIVELFTKTLNEKRAMNFHLNELAQYMINIQATEPKSRGFYIPKGRFGGKRYFS